MLKQVFILFLITNSILGFSFVGPTQRYYFTENKGQLPQPVLFQASFPQGNVYIETGGLTYQFYRLDHTGHAHETEEHNEERPAGKGHSYKVEFLQHTWNGIAKKENPSPFYFNYLKGNPETWASEVLSYEKVQLENVFPGIDVHYYVQENNFKYDFSVQAHSDVQKIKLNYSGADSLFIKNGHLFIRTSMGDIRESKPFAYQTIKGVLQPVVCNYRLNGTTVTFDFPKGYDRSQLLIIDPELIFSTYSGSFGDNWGNTATYDTLGNGYAAGTLFQIGYPTTTGAFQIVYRGTLEFKPFPTDPSTGIAITDPDIAIMKISSSGSLVYATLLGGSNSDIPSSIIVNHKNELVILGVTGSSSAGGLFPFPTTSTAIQTEFAGGARTFPLGFEDAVHFDIGTDLFVSILNPTGTGLIGSTYLGGTSNDGIYDLFDPICRNYGDQFRGEVTVDSIDQIYVATKTFSSDIAKSTTSTFSGGKSDGYIAKLSSDASVLHWDNYIGGSGMDAAYSVQLNTKGELYVAGGTGSTNFPVTSGAHKTRINFGDVDGFICRYSGGGTLLQATYIGSVAYDQCFFVQLDTLDKVYTIGQTRGSIPLINSAWNIPNGGQFIQKLDAALSSIEMSTTFGSSNGLINISINAFTVTDCGKILLSGWGGTVNQGNGYVGGTTFNMPITADAFKGTTDGSDFYLMVIDENANGLLYATFFGSNTQIGEAGDHVDGGTSRFDKKGIIYQAVCASCGGFDGFPTTANAHSRTNNAGNCNNALFKFDLTQLRADFTIGQTRACNSLNVTVSSTSVGGNSFSWKFGDGTTANGPGPHSHSYNQPGKYPLTLIATDNTTCLGRDSITRWVEVFASPDIPLSVKDTAICFPDTLQLLTLCDPFLNYEWTPNMFIDTPSSCSTRFFPPATMDYILTVRDTNTCIRRDTIRIEVAKIEKGIQWINRTECTGNPKVELISTSAGPLNYFWTFGDGTSSTVRNPIHSYNSGGTYPIVVDIFNSICQEQDTLTISVQPIVIPNLITPNQDGKNDCFEITGIYPDWEVGIYNAWGDRVFFSESYHQQFCGQGLSESVYYYIVCSPQGECCKGWLHTVNKR